MFSPVVYLGNKEIFHLQNVLSTSEIVDQVTKHCKLLPSDFYLTSNGKILSNKSELFAINRVDLNLRIFGGKGGFGSMLRAIGAQIEKTTNREACRDLSGRRLRDINEEKRLKAWLDKQKDRDAEAKERKRKKLEKLMAVPKHEFKDSEYESIRAEMTENVSDAVEEGFKKAANAVNVNMKRKTTDDGASKPKKAALWFDDDISSSSDTDDDSESDEITKKNQEKINKCDSESSISDDAGAGSSRMSKEDNSNSTVEFISDLSKKPEQKDDTSNSSGSAIEK